MAVRKALQSKLFTLIDSFGGGVGRFLQERNGLEDSFNEHSASIGRIYPGRGSSDTRTEGAQAQTRRSLENEESELIFSANEIVVGEADQS